MEIKSNVGAAEWQEHPHFAGLQICVRPLDSREARAAYRRELNRQTRMRRVNDLEYGDSRALEERALMAQAAGACAGWKTPGGEPLTLGGEELEYSPEVMEKLVTVPEAREFLDGIFILAQRLRVRDKIDKDLDGPEEDAYDPSPASEPTRRGKSASGS